MKQQELEQHLLSNPEMSDDELARILAENPHLLDESIDDEFEKAMKQAMHVEAPQGLEAKLKQIPFQDAAQSANDNKISLPKPALAVAASVMFAFGLAAGQINWGNLLVSPANAQVEQLIEHVEGEQVLVPKGDVNYSAAQINPKLAAYGYQFKSDLPYPVRYMNNCGFINKTHAMHMQVQGQSGADIIVFIAHEKPMLTEFEREGHKGLTYPIKQGVLVLMTQGEDDLQQVARDIAAQIEVMPSVNQSI
ncbi:MAG: DUF3379 family protein [Vibrio sp.]